MITQTEEGILSKKDAFELLMLHAVDSEEIRGLRACFITSHPFGLDIPHCHPRLPTRDIAYIGTPGYTDCSVDGMLRIIAQIVSFWGHRWSHEVHHLRVIYCGNSDGHDIYYEVGIMDKLYISGGCTDCSGGGGSGKSTMDGVFQLLSDVYNVPIQKVELDFKDRDGQSFVEDFLKENSVPQEEHEPIVKGDHTFQPGDKVYFGAFARENPPSFVSKQEMSQLTLEIERTEDVVRQCSCGLGLNVPTMLHPERCGVFIASQQMHHQFVYVRIGDAIKRLSGVFFEPVTRRR